MLGSVIFTAVTIRVPLILTAGSKACHEVPRGGTGAQAQNSGRGRNIRTLPLPPVPSAPERLHSAPGSSASPGSFPHRGKSDPLEKSEQREAVSPLKIKGGCQAIGETLMSKFGRSPGSGLSAPAPDTQISFAHYSPAIWCEENVRGTDAVLVTNHPEMVQNI